MNLVIKSESLIGNRHRNLDRIFEFNTGKVCGCVLIDGFSSLDAGFHYVDFLVDFFNEMIVDGMDIDRVESVFYECSIAKTKYFGKAAMAVVLHSENEVRSSTVGDVRIYFLSERERSIDDSLAQRLIATGLAPEESINKHPLRNKLTKYISKDSNHALPPFKSKIIKSGDIIVMCTDGFWSNYKDDEIFRISSSKKIIELVCSIDNCNGQDKDNISASFLQFQST